MKTVVKEILLVLITAILIIGLIPTNIVNAAETEEPSPHDVLHYVIDNKDLDYLSKYEYMFPASMVSEIRKAINDNITISIDSNEELVFGDTAVYGTNINGPMDQHLTKSSGVFQGPSGKETYYNLNMSGVVSIMRSMGYDEESYPYWVRDDGAKMLGPYVMVAAAFSIRPRGTILETSLGTAIVCDTGGFAYSNPSQLDIATSW